MELGWRLPLVIGPHVYGMSKRGMKSIVSKTIKDWFVPSPGDLMEHGWQLLLMIGLYEYGMQSPEKKYSES